LEIKKRNRKGVHISASDVIPKGVEDHTHRMSIGKGLDELELGKGGAIAYPHKDVVA
jgi:hypothetical protein